MLKGKNQLEDMGIDGKTVLKMDLNKQSVRVWTEFNWLGALMNTVMNLRLP
jgi:hypothetical protein